ncbi:DUF5104 domain-containing protein [Butyrivibrio fibrisolvens]|jgi:hypothetical protein|uniref:DUF5104 domain-containing protein n=1 Tax=Butyrivibrio fibrisolvens TaxID=831 RepID=UPI0003B4EB88|nr:DUF5104 domain-containing protein [Butyrivibrio fibrisolvens]
MYRLIRSVIIIFVSITLITGCKNNNESGTSNKLFYSFWNSDQKISDEIIEKIVDGINYEDTDKIKNLFSVNALEKSESLDNDIQNLFEFIDGPIISYEEGNGSGSSMESSDSTYKIKILYTCYYISTANEDYFIDIKTYTDDTQNADLIGVKYLIIVKADDMMKIYDGDEKILFDGTEEIDRYGVFIPDIY